VVNRLDLLAGLLCLGGVAAAGALAGTDALVATVGRAVFVMGLSFAGLCFLAASTAGSLGVGNRRVNSHALSAIGDAAVGVGILGGFASVPSGTDGVVYVVLVAAGGASAVLFGVVGLAERSGWL
jgi:hypothetical protein